MAVGRAESSIERTRLFELENEKHQENHDDDGVGDLSQERVGNPLNPCHSRQKSHEYTLSFLAPSVAVVAIAVVGIQTSLLKHIKHSNTDKT